MVGSLQIFFFVNPILIATQLSLAQLVLQLFPYTEQCPAQQQFQPGKTTEFGPARLTCLTNRPTEINQEIIEVFIVLVPRSFNNSPSHGSTNL